MPHPVFSAHIRHMDALHSARLLDAAQAATAQYQPASWWDGMVSRARGVAHEVGERVGPLFTFNKAPINTGAGLRRAFSQSVSGSRVEA